MGEVVQIPTRGPEARVGAAVYFAVLAYPDRVEWRARFLRVIERWRRYPQQPLGREHRRHYDHAVDRIAERRMPAARACELARMASHAWFPTAPTLSGAARSVSATGTVHVDPKNWLAFAWADSKPVMPLALGLRRCGYDEDLERFVLLERIAHPHWVHGAVQSAANWNRMLPLLMPDSFGDTEFVQLTPL